MRLSDPHDSWMRPEYDGETEINPGFSGLTDLTRECLRDAGIADEADLGKSTLDDVLGALTYDQDSVDELWRCCGIPRPSRADEVLGLLSASGIARERLETYLEGEESIP